MTIYQPVGPGKPNASRDVLVVQRALHAAHVHFRDNGLDPGMTDGLWGSNTQHAIEHFQRRCGGVIDGVVDPHGFTARHLTELARTVTQAKTWTSPMRGAPDKPYLGSGAGQRQFEARRSGGKRAHAGSDFYADEGRAVYAVAAGRIGFVGPFYLGTDEVQQHVNGGTVVRYGEIKPAVRTGQLVSQGEIIGHIKYMRYANGRCLKIGGQCQAMLHIEVFSGAQSGRLTRRTGGARASWGRKFFRRGDLMHSGTLLSRLGTP